MKIDHSNSVNAALASSQRRIVANTLVSEAELMQNVSGRKLSIAHCAIGMLGEFVEVMEAIDEGNIEKAKEEIGDIVYYCVATLEKLGHIATEEDFKTPKGGIGVDDAISNLGTAINNAISPIKKHCFYSLPLQNEASKIFTIHAIAMALELAAIMGISPREVIEFNVEKLRKRYPAGRFSPAAAAAKLDAVRRPRK